MQIVHQICNILADSHSLFDDNRENSSEITIRSSVKSSQLTTESAILKRKPRRKPDEHYWDINSLSSKDSSHSSKLSAPGDKLALQHQRKNEHYWEGTNVEKRPTPETLVASQDESFLSSKQEKAHLRLRDEHYWEGYNEAPPIPQQHSSQNKCDVRHKRRTEKPYWA